MAGGVACIGASLPCRTRQCQAGMQWSGSKEMHMTKHIVLGVGQIGSRVARALVAQGEEVVVVKRSAGDPGIRGVEVKRGDLGDAAFAKSIGRGAAVVYQCTNPAYHR